MPSSRRIWFVGGLALLALVVLLGFLVTRSDSRASQRRRNAAKDHPGEEKLVDTSPLDTAHALSNIPSTAEERKLAEEAARVADSEVDLAFVMALHQAQEHVETNNSAAADIKALKARVQTIQNRLQQVQQQADKLTKLAAAGGKNSDVIQQQLEVAQARLTLLKDRLDDAKQDLLRAGGDREAQVQQELDDHEAREHAASAAPLPAKPQTFAVAGNLIGEFRTWQRLRSNRRRLLDAQAQAESAVKTLTRKHNALEQGGSDDEQSDNTSEDANSPALVDQAKQTATLANLQSLAQRAKTSAAYDKRIQAEQQLAKSYGEWVEVLDEQLRAVEHAVLRSLLWILLTLLALTIVEGLVERFYVRLSPDRRRMGTARLVLRFVTQVIGLMVVLLVLFGVPSQLSTVLALAGAGLTVALKDFIVAFFGWFVLMGSHGIRVGDWVEINGIGGEVVSIGFLRTILLETGNWSDAGHPTGRKVSFVNSFAIEGHYFNFTTTGQWLWDELDVLIPMGDDPFYLMNSVLKVVTEQTAEDTRLAEEEWRRSTHDSVVQSFSATPAINVRPTNLGVNLVVRYIVRAQDRYPVRTRLYEAIVALLHERRATAQEESTTAKPRT